MKEERYFYCPNPQCGQLPPEEADHALKVLRLTVGDQLTIIDGAGGLYQAQINRVGKGLCAYTLLSHQRQQPTWRGSIHLAIAPTKMMERTEWMAEKATEIGLNHLSFLDCRFSERRAIKRERIERIVISAAKQSHKATIPTIDELTTFEKFVNTTRHQRRFIAHCYNQAELCPGGKPFLLNAITPNDSDLLVLVGPEGDFSVDEVQLAITQGFEPVSLGPSRLRTETAGLVAVHLMQLGLGLS